MPSDEKQAAMEAYVEAEAAYHAGELEGGYTTLKERRRAYLAIIEREKQPEGTLAVTLAAIPKPMIRKMAEGFEELQRRETAEGLLERVGAEMAGHGAKGIRWYRDEWRTDLTRALALIRADRERVERAVAQMQQARNARWTREGFTMADGMPDGMAFPNQLDEWIAILEGKP